jgi:hypothetical protein
VYCLHIKKSGKCFFSQSSVLKKGLSKYDKINGITPMKTHVDYVHPKLFIQRKSQLLKKQQWAMMQIMCGNEGKKT